MDDLISRQAAIDAYGDWYVEEGTEEGFIGTVKQLLEGLPSAERTGRWIFDIDDKGWSWDKPYVCDQCGEWAEKEFKFCPSCGVAMRVEK